MNIESRILYHKDLSDAAVADGFSKVKAENEGLHDAICTNLQNENTYGVREDILKYLSEHAAEIKTDGDEQEYYFSIASLIANPKVSPDHLAWVVLYFTDIKMIDVSDFMIIFSEAVDKEIPLSEIKEFYGKAGSNEVQLYEDILSYEKKSTEKEENKETVDDKERGEETSTGLTESIPVSVVKNEEEPKDNGMAEMLSSLMVALSYGKGTDDSVLSVQDGFNKIVAKFQISLTELSSYVTEVTRIMERTQEELKQTKALNQIQQKMLSSQQRRINELQGSLMIQEDRIQDAKKSEARQAEIRRKIKELRDMTDAEDVYNGDITVTPKSM